MSRLSLKSYSYMCMKCHRNHTTTSDRRFSIGRLHWEFRDKVPKKNKYTHAERVKAAKKALRTKRKRYGKDLKKG